MRMSDHVAGVPGGGFFVGERGALIDLDGDESISQVNPARVYARLLGSSDAFAADRVFTSRLVEVFPGAATLAQAHRAFVIRAVGVMAQAGVEQFLDMSAGWPLWPAVHQAAAHPVPGRRYWATWPGVRVVYVEGEALAARMLTEEYKGTADLPGLAGVRVVRAEPTDAVGILTHPLVWEFLDYARPVGVIAAGLWRFPRAVLRETVSVLRMSLARGSHPIPVT